MCKYKKKWELYTCISVFCFFPSNIFFCHSILIHNKKKREFLNNALIVQTKSSHICGIRNTSFVHTFILSYKTHWGAQDCWIRYIFWKHVIHIIELIDAGYYFVWVEIQWSYFCLFQKIHSLSFVKIDTEEIFFLLLKKTKCFQWKCIINSHWKLQ